MNKIKVIEPLIKRGGRFKRSKAEERKIEPPTPVVPTTPERKQPKARDPQLMFLLLIPNCYFVNIIPSSSSSFAISRSIESFLISLALIPRYPKKAVQSISPIQQKNQVNEAIEHLSNPKIDDLVGEPFPKLARVNNTVAISIKPIYLEFSHKIEQSDFVFLFLLNSRRYSEKSLFPVKSDGFVSDILDDNFESFKGRLLLFCS